MAQTPVLLRCGPVCAPAPPPPWSLAIRLATVKVPTNGGSQTWATLSTDVKDLVGVKDLHLRFTGEKGKTLFKVVHWRFE